MGIVRIIVEMDFRRAMDLASYLTPYNIWRGWSDYDLANLAKKVDNPGAYPSPGMIKITKREFRAWPELNRRIAAIHHDAVRAPLLAWVEKKGLYPVIRVHRPTR